MYTTERFHTRPAIVNDLFALNTYILIDGFTYYTRGYFASCVVFFRDLVSHRD